MTDIIVADYNNPKHADAVVNTLDAYARDPMGGTTPLGDHTRANLAASLAKIPGAFSVLAYKDGAPVGLANCFYQFSTFKCRPLVNIHDFVVTPDARHAGIGIKMLAKIEELAREKRCCKITLEVLSGNTPAKNLYVKSGFRDYELDPEMGHALFWEKPLA